MRALAWPLAASILLLSVWLLGSSEGNTCYDCAYTNRSENVSFNSSESCIDNFGRSTINCNHFFPERKFCLKAYEDGFTSDGAYYQTIVRTCIQDVFPTPCVTTDKFDSDPVIKRAVATINNNGSGMVGHGTLTMCLCVGDLCNDEPGLNATKGSFEDNGNDVDAGSMKLSSKPSMLLFPVIFIMFASVFFVAPV